MNCFNVSVPAVDSWKQQAAPPHHCVHLEASAACLGIIHFHTQGFLLPLGSCLKVAKAPSPARLPCLLLLKSSGSCVHGRFPLDPQPPLIYRAGQDIKALPKAPLIVSVHVVVPPRISPMDDEPLFSYLLGISPWDELT